MSSTNSIDIAGLIRSTKTRGFTVRGSINELLDNSLDASARVIALDFDTAARLARIADDGEGMPRSKAKDCYRFHSDKPASGKSGLYGIGKPVAEGVLSDLKEPTTTITKAADDVVYEVTADWPSGETTGTWMPFAHPVSLAGNHIWETRALDRNHGTVVQIPMQARMLDAMVASMGEIAKDLAFTYQDYLADGCRIRLTVDGVEVPIPTDRSLGWDAVAPHRRNLRMIQIWKKEDEERIYHDGDDGWARLDLSKATPEQAKRFKDYADVVAAGSGWEKSGEFALFSVYNPEWNPEGESFIPGYTAFCRNRRYLAALPAEPPTHGDFERRKVIGSARHVLKYTYREDAYIRPEGNKSNVTKENIHPELFKTVKILARWWAATYYSRHMEAPPPPEDDAVRATPRIVKEFKLFFENDDEWRREYEALCARYRV